MGRVPSNLQFEDYNRPNLRCAESDTVFLLLNDKDS